jgi:lysozyme
MPTDIQMTPGNKDPGRYKKHVISAAIVSLIAAGASSTDILDQFLYEKEGSRLTAYQDGAQIWTICKGLTTYSGQPIHPGMKLTAKECREADRKFIEQDLREAQQIVKPDVWSELSPAAQAAVGDLVHNLGKAKAANSTAIRLLNEGKRNEGCAAITLWINDHGRDCRKAGSNCQGQPIRRMQEDELCLTPTGAES